jgi:hypothetical protein
MTRPSANCEYREIYRNRYLRGILIRPLLTSVSYAIGACMLTVLGCVFVWLAIGLLNKEAGSLTNAWTLAQRSPGKALCIAALALSGGARRGLGSRRA